MKHGEETLRGLRYKVRMMGIPLTGPSYIYGDNKSQVTNSSRPESTLKKKCNSICYHAIRESVAMGESLITHIKTDDKPQDWRPVVLLNCTNQLVMHILNARLRSIVQLLQKDYRDCDKFRIIFQTKLLNKGEMSILPRFQIFLLVWVMCCQE